MVTTTTGSGRKDNIGSDEEFTVTNWVQDKALVCTTDDASLGNVLGTLIKVLQDKGILGGTTAST